MGRLQILLTVGCCLLLAACTGSDPVEPSASSQPSTTSPATDSSLVAGNEDDPPEFTDFRTTSACDPDAEDANLQVIEAFITAYNDRDETRLAELTELLVTVDDLNGIPHLGTDRWTGVTDWAHKGWEVDDRFELTSLVMYDGGSVFEVDRSNDVLSASGIESLHHTWKVHSGDCVISHMVLYLPFGEVGESECRFWDSFATDLAQGTDQGLVRPEACSD
jgi:hypothetical protein